MQPVSSAAMYHLSEGSLERITSGEEVECPLYFQILGFRNLINFSPGEDSNRYRLKISDGKTIYSFVILLSTMNKLIHSQHLTELSIVIVNKYITRTVKHNGQDRVIIIITNLDVLVPGYQINTILGSADVSFLDEKMKLIDLTD